MLTVEFPSERIQSNSDEDEAPNDLPSGMQRMV